MNDTRYLINEKFFISLGVVVAIIAGWYFISPFWRTVYENEEAPTGPVLAQGLFVSEIYRVEGRALLIASGGKRILRFENFKTINGPGFHVYLAFNKDSKDHIDLGEMKATEGNVNYEVPASVDLRKYTAVLIWSQPFRTLFSYAELR
ncbi:MAG: DM13 domain-containing protein [Patescibacteria group bacterium]